MHGNDFNWFRIPGKAIILIPSGRGGNRIESRTLRLLQVRDKVNEGAHIHSSLNNNASVGVAVTEMWEVPFILENCSCFMMLYLTN